MSERVWEVFRQEDEGDPMIHGGNVNAPDEELALHYAREFYGRRQESRTGCGSCRATRSPSSTTRTCSSRRSIASFKRPGGYIIKHKLEAAKRARQPEALRVTATRVALDIGDSRRPGRAAAQHWPTTSS